MYLNQIFCRLQLSIKPKENFNLFHKDLFFYIILIIISLTITIHGRLKIFYHYESSGSYYK